MFSISQFLVTLLFLSWASAKQWTCTVAAAGNSSIDDTPAIREAFDECNQHSGRVIFTNTTYHVNTVLQTTGLKNLDIDIKGTLQWSTNITYWLANSLDVGYQNQSTAWILGGDNVHINGFGYGTIDGNGEAWYTSVGGVSNYPRRPHGVTFNGLNNSVVEGVRFLNSQMWTMSIIYSKNTTFDQIWVSNLRADGNTTRNTDGADTFFSSFITFSNWIVINGDDSISLKANSTDITIRDCTFYRGLGVAIGSIGQYAGEFETIERVRVSGIKFYKTLHAVYFKTWTGEQVGYPPNGGGGGLGHTTDLVFENLFISESRGTPFDIDQCTSFSGVTGNCTSSHFQVRDVTVRNLTGMSTNINVARMKCAALTCPFLTLEDFEVKNSTSGVAIERYSCSNLRNYTGFTCA